MARAEISLSQRAGYQIAAGVAVSCAIGLEVIKPAGGQPVIGTMSLVPAGVLAAIVGLPLAAFLERRGVSPSHIVRVTASGTAKILVLGGLLALPPIAIDVAMGFPRELNLPLPGALFFYPGIAIVAEVVFHLAPLALLCVLLPRALPRRLLIWPVVFVEPLFQIFFLSGPPVMSALVLGNVALVSAGQMWLFRREGFLAMIGLRLAFYLFWHIAWGQARLTLLF